ncbi:hypothetical protein PR202_gb02354 [Eleusine coracana subsp. coracana]|uniref:Uncharacterized protein n=1 Tax=Eleusine coracana subsp. coracana TaxID=191504 RepID=A0AAV5DZ56_ELECO|nr:hypothetical protein PR202_gb02354 [Eleusine coracana subsp. coracana]
MDQTKVALQQITGSLHAVHGILEDILRRISDDRAVRIDQRYSIDTTEGLEFLAVEAHNVHELAKEVESKLSECMEIQRKEKNRVESRISSLEKENQDIHTMLKIAITEKEAVESSLRVLKDDSEQGRSAILQLAEKGLQKVGFGFIMEVISGEQETDGMSTSSATATTSGSDQEVVSLVNTSYITHSSLANTLSAKHLTQTIHFQASIVENTMKTLHQEISDLRQTLDESRSDSDHFQLLATERHQKIMKYESYIKDLETRESLLVNSVEEHILTMKAVQQEAARWRKACELEVEAGKSAIKELNQEITLLREELGRAKADLEAANSKLMLKEKLAASAMAAQAAADACLKLADSRSAGLQQRIEELTRQIEGEDPNGRKEKEISRRKIRYVCWPWQQLRVISASSRARTWFVDQNGRLLPRAEALLQARI